MTKEHVNFYESIKEANARLKDTIVLYEGRPYYVLAITDHKADGVFRMYLDELGRPEGMAHTRYTIPYDWYDELGCSKGDKMDEWLEKNPDKGVIRKMMNSPHFNKFRPFPLGMCNNRGKVFYLERQPTRYTQQGLISSMIMHHEITPTGGIIPSRGSSVPGFAQYEFYRCIMGEYPRPDECLSNLHDANIANEGMAFARDFAFMRGPVGLMFLAYKQDIVGYMPTGDFSSLILSLKFKHTLEVVSNLNLFEKVSVSTRS